MKLEKKLTDKKTCMSQIYSELNLKNVQRLKKRSVSQLVRRAIAQIAQKHFKYIQRTSSHGYSDVRTSVLGPQTPIQGRP